MFIDAHHHLWDLDKVHYPWLMARGEARFFGQPDPIRQNYLWEDFVQDHQNLVHKSVHIQVGASDPVAETAFVQSQADKHPQIAAIIAAATIDSYDLPEQIAAQRQFPLLRGLRHIIGKSPEENQQMPIFSGSSWLPGLRLLASENLSFDCQLTCEQYPAVLETLQQVPELKVVLCHFASPWDQSDNGFAKWQMFMREFAKLPNCYIKLSGFSMFGHQFNQHAYLKYASEAIDIFSAKRCMLGSNFPVDSLHMSYQQLSQAWLLLVSALDRRESQQLCSLTAKSFYKL